MGGLNELSREELIALVQELHSANLALQETNRLLSVRVSTLEKEVAELRSQLPGGGASAPSWVKANCPKGEKKARKKRAKSFCRRRDTPTEYRVHAVDHCPDCGQRLSGGWVHDHRQVIEIPETPISVIEHVIIRRQCGVCGKRWTPSLDLSGEVVGKHRVGVRLMSLIGYLKTVCRLPVRTIKSLLFALYGVHLSEGEIAELLHTVASCGEGVEAELLEQIRQSEFSHADETGWRQDGQNGYIWSFSTPKIRYFVYNKSRSGQIPKDILGEEYSGALVTDFLSSYSVLLCPHQRCWVHYLRDLHKLKEDHEADVGVALWVKGIGEIYDRAKAFKSDRPQVRRLQRERFEQELYEHAKPYLGVDCPQRVLAQRIERFLPELFVFVEHPQVPSENNAAERAIRPAVIARKISGGTRSAKGSETKMTLMSLFGTWVAQGLDSLEACRLMLIGTSKTAGPAPAESL